MDFSIIICTYNPKEKILQRLFNAIKKFESNKLNFEVILVDNNSKVRLNTERYVSDFLKETCAKLIIEEKPGLTSARIAGITEAKGKWLVFFDDDNEPAQDYLIQANQAIIQFPKVGAWGPGKINVEFEDEKVHVWFKKNKKYFQENDNNEIKIDNQQTWCECYPNGTGLILTNIIAKEYVELVNKNKFTLSDRIGKSLLSGGDTQMVFLVIKKGFYAGISPNLILRHIISEDKTIIKYVLKQVYMTSSCYVKAFNEMEFDNHKIPIKLESNLRIVDLFFKSAKNHFLKFSFRNFTIDYYTRLGQLNARYVALDMERKPLLLVISEKIINV